MKKIVKKPYSVKVIPMGKNTFSETGQRELTVKKDLRKKSRSIGKPANPRRIPWGKKKE